MTLRCRTLHIGFMGSVPVSRGTPGAQVVASRSNCKGISLGSRPLRRHVRCAMLSRGHLHPSVRRNIAKENRARSEGGHYATSRVRLLRVTKQSTSGLISSGWAITAGLRSCIIPHTSFFVFYRRHDPYSVHCQDLEKWVFLCMTYYWGSLCRAILVARVPPGQIALYIFVFLLDSPCAVLTV